MTESKKSFKVKWWLGTTDGDNRAPAALAEAGETTLVVGRMTRRPN